MKSAFVAVLLVMAAALGCRGRSGPAQRSQQQYEVIEEGQTGSATATINAPGEVQPPATATNTDTTGTFALGTALPPTNMPGGPVGGVLPPQQPAPMSSGTPPPAPAPRATVYPPITVTTTPQPPRERRPPPTQTDTTSTTTSSDTAPPTDTSQPPPPPPTQTDTIGGH